MYDLVIIGGGAGGLACAINAKRINNNLRVCIIEKLPKLGKKILATGNGRCNITNLTADKSCYNNSDFVEHTLKKYTPKKVIDFFENIGLKCIEESQGRVYPLSNSAVTVQECLINEINHLKIDVLYDTKVERVNKSGNTFIINNEIKSKNLVIATGGKSSQSQGSDGSGFDILSCFSHKITPTYPGLVQVKTKQKVKALKGVRAKANVKLICDDNIIDSSSGEILFTDYGLSGIAIMDISRSVKNRKCRCILDVLPGFSFDDMFDFCNKCKINNPENTIENVISGLLIRKLARYILALCKVNSEKSIGSISNNELKNIFSSIKNLKFDITGTNDFNNSQITIGGADTRYFDKITLQSKIIYGLYCVGEVLDVDSICGGFNLQWAWASGLAVGENIAKK